MLFLTYLMAHQVCFVICTVGPSLLDISSGLACRPGFLIVLFAQELDHARYKVYYFFLQFLSRLVVSFLQRAEATLLFFLIQAPIGL